MIDNIHEYVFWFAHAVPSSYHPKHDVIEILIGPDKKPIMVSSLVHLHCYCWTDRLGSLNYWLNLITLACHK